MPNRKDLSQELVAALEDAVVARGSRREGGEVRFLCPVHNDRNPSARWNRAKAVWICDACGQGGGALDLAKRLGVELPAMPKTDALKVTTVYAIRDLEGRLVAEHVRIESPERKKTYAWRREGRMGLRGLRIAELPLYGAERIAGFDRAREVFLCEGEKATARLVSIGAQAVGSVTGAGSVPGPGPLSVLQGRDVVLWPDQDAAGARHMERIAAQLREGARSVRTFTPLGLPPRGDAVEWIEQRMAEGKPEELILEELVKAAREALGDYGPPVGVKAAPVPANRWSSAVAAPEFLAASDDEVEFLEARLLAPGALTEWFSPRGLGKTHAAHAIAVKLARAGRRVLLLDRDNSAREVRRRLRGWGGAEAHTLEVMTREHVPPLTDGVAWRDFPVAGYDLLIVDSLDSAAEGVGERDSEKPSRALAVLLDVARRERGPAILVLGNTVKTAEHSRGSGVVEDRADIVFEVRDATDLRPTGDKPWIEELPPAGAGSWVQRATRRQRRDRYRLAYVPTKFRIGEEPAPFILEVDLSAEPWTLRDVTEVVDRAGVDNRLEREREEQERRDKGLAALTEEVKVRALAGKPLVKSEAEQLLSAHGLTRSASRALIAAEAAWQLEELADRRGKPVALLPWSDSGEDGGENIRSSRKLCLPGINARVSSADQAGKARRELAATRPRPDSDFPNASFPAADEVAKLGSGRIRVLERN